MRSKGSTLLASLLAISYGFASETVFSVNDDVLAYPQVCSGLGINSRQLTSLSSKSLFPSLTYQKRTPT